VSGAPTKSITYDRSDRFSPTSVPHNRKPIVGRALICALAACALFGGCRPSEVAAADRTAEIQTLVGGSMADFIRRTGLTPSDMYPTSSGRTFVVNGPVSTSVLPGFYGVPSRGRLSQRGHHRLSHQRERGRGEDRHVPHSG
jgi:hypothetical protein